MNLKTMLSKKSILIISSCVLLVVVVGVTYALLRSYSPTAENNFSGKAVNIGVIEDGGKTKLENKDNVISFDSIKKDIPANIKVQIKNIDSEDYPTNDTIVRVRVVPCLRYDTNSKYAGELVAMDIKKNVTYDINNTNWIVNIDKESGETYYYYTKVLKPNELSEALFTKVTYTGDVPAGTYLELQVLADGIHAEQAANSDIPWGYNILKAK